MQYMCKPGPDMLPSRPGTARPPSAPSSFRAAAALPGADALLKRLAVRSGHSLTPAGSQVVLFGGELSTEHERLCNSLLRLERERMTWHAQVNRTGSMLCACSSMMLKQLLVAVGRMHAHVLIMPESAICGGEPAAACKAINSAAAAEESAEACACCRL